MEAALPISGAPEARAVQPRQVRAAVPSVSLPLRFMLTGLVALFFVVGWIITKPSILASYHYNQYVIAATHLVVLGFICTVVHSFPTRRSSDLDRKSVV